MPVLLKMETDQLVSKKSFEMFSKNISWFNVFILILGAILFVAIVEKIIVSFTNILVKSKKDLLENEIKLKLFEKMEFMEVGRTMSSRYKYISSLVGSEFWKFSNRIINIPSNGLQFFIQIIWITAIYSYFNIILLFIVIISSLFWYFISIASRKLMGKYEINWKLDIWREFSKHNNLFLYHFSDLAISWWVSSTIKKYGIAK
jgi:ABC-type multidrug transport system fused ATPase/permease subunit